MKKFKSKTWTEAENDLLLEYYHTMGQDTLLAILPGRTLRDMAAQVSYLKRKNKTFKVNYKA